MLICHKLVVSNEAAVLQESHVSDVLARKPRPASLQHRLRAALHRRCMPCQRLERLCAAECHNPVLSVTSGFSNTTTLQQCLTTTTVGRPSCHTHQNCMHAEQIIIIYIYIYYFFLLSLFVIVFKCIIQNNSCCLQ